VRFEKRKIFALNDPSNLEAHIDTVRYQKRAKITYFYMKRCKKPNTALKTVNPANAMEY